MHGDRPIRYKSRRALIAGGCLLLALALGGATMTPMNGIDAERAALERSLAEAKAASKRSEALEAQARRARRSADRIRREEEALAARIQQSEADITAAEARLALLSREQRALSARLAKKRQPIARLTAALQNLSRRPTALVMLQPGSAKDIVRLRAIMATIIPQIEIRTKSMRGDLIEARAVRRRVEQEALRLREGRKQLADRRSRLAQLETRQRLNSRKLGDTARIEEQRALGLADQARDIEALVVTLQRSGRKRDRLALLDGPIIRPPRPEKSVVVDASLAKRRTTRFDYQLPVVGEIVTGFGAPLESGLRSRGLEMLTRPGALVVAPAAGRVSFAGPFRGFDTIVIVEHAGGLTSLITGMVQSSVRVGDQIAKGAPMGTAKGGRSPVAIELRRNGEPVDIVSRL